MTENTRSKSAKKEILSTIEEILDEKWDFKKIVLLVVVISMPMGIPIAFLYFATRYIRRKKSKKKAGKDEC